jgi:phospholipid-transporting ATPase
MDGVHIPVGPNNILLRGCELKNTSWVIGVVVYAGKQTKAMLNNSGAQSKRSRLEREMNKATGYLVLFLLALCLVGGLGMGLWLHAHRKYLDDLPYYRKRNYEEFDFKKGKFEDYNYYGIVGEGVIAFLSCIIVFQIMVPIALYISLELVRLWQAHFMTLDMQMYHDDSKSRFQCRALNINEDLGQVKYVFSDKTGTLTENKMEFHSASVAGVEYAKAQSSNLPDGTISSEDSAGQFSCPWCYLGA